MKKVSCIVMCCIMLLTSVAVLSACSDGSLPEGTYYSVAVDGGTGAGKYAEGNICRVTATVPEGKQFMKWLKNGQDASVNAEYSFEVTENSRLIAVFGDGVSDPDAEVCYVTTTNGIGNGGYFKGSQCTVKLPENEMDRNFKGWASVVDGVAGDIVSTDKIYTFTVGGSITLEALYNDVRLPMPDNSDNKMFNLNAGAAVIEYDRQVDPVTGERITAFVKGVAYVKIYVYIDAAEEAEPIGWFKMATRGDNSGYFENAAGTSQHNLSGEPGNFHTPDGNTHNWLKSTIGGMSNGPYSTEIPYYFATQAVGQTVDDVIYIDSEISGKGRGVLNM